MIAPWDHPSDPWIARVNGFWAAFMTAELYDAGYGDVIESCGASQVTSRTEAMLACAFISGSAQMARLANTYMTPAWQIAQVVSCASGITLSLLRDQTLTAGVLDTQLSRLMFTWRAELRALLGKTDTFIDVIGRDPSPDMVTANDSEHERRDPSEDNETPWGEF